MEEWQREVNELRLRLRAIADDGRNPPDRRAKANEFQFYSNKGIYNYRQKINLFCADAEKIGEELTKVQK